MDAKCAVKGLIKRRFQEAAVKTDKNRPNT